MSKRIHGWLATLLIVSILLLAFPITAFADGGGEGLEKEVDGYHIKLVFAEAVKVGENKFHIQITDALGAPVTGAEVKAAAMPIEGMDDGHGAEEEPSVGVMTSNSDMDSMDMESETPETGEMKPNDPAGGHGEEEAAAIVLEPGHEAGEYEGELHIETSGDWMFNVSFAVNGETKTVEFPVGVGRQLGLNYAILAGFVGVNATVITSAAILKKRKPAVIRK